jgi:hypothetical protein
MIVPSGASRALELKLVGQTGGNAANPGAGPGDGLSSVSADFQFSPHLGRLFIDVLTPGASYTLDSGGDLRSGATTAVEPGRGAVALALGVPRPNPGTGTVRAELEVPEGGAHGRWTVVDAAGRLVWGSAPQSWFEGRARLEWSGVDARGHAVPAGVYFLRVESDRGTVSRRLVRVD